MASYNRVMLMGNLTRDIELRYLPSGTAVTEFGLAVNDRRKTSDGQWVDDVSFFDVTLFGRTAEVASEYLSKGSPIFIEGRLKQDTWEKEGQKRSKVKVIGERMQMIGSKDRSESSGGGVRESSRSSYRSYESQPSDNRQSSDDYDEPAPRHDAQPTGEGPGYDDSQIPF
mgnify:CR=1 FL=1